MNSPATSRVGRPGWPGPDVTARSSGPGSYVGPFAFEANPVRLQLHALPYNLGNFTRILSLPEGTELWPVTSLREKLIVFGARRSPAIAAT